jgi:hypothetical protein
MVELPSDIRRVYHFVEQRFGLEDIQQRRLKIATFGQLNDPFEFFGANLTNPELRRAFRDLKEQLGARSGMLCFSRNWSNPVQWSHYADKHCGLCLGFDVPCEHLRKVSYSKKRFFVDAQRLLNPSQLDEKTAQDLLFTKFSHWRYENEIRSFVSLEEVDPETGLYFADFSDRLRLREVIVGAHSTLPEADLLSALGELQQSVKITKARLAFGSFNVVRQRDKRLWWPTHAEDAARLRQTRPREVKPCE